MRQCTICQKDFEPKFTTMQQVCGLACARRVPIVQRQADKDRLKRRADWMKDAQTAFNAYIRARDEALPCVSCGRMHDGQWHAGHYLSTGARPELRFDETNVHKQCQPCNTHLHGNLVLYRVELLKRIGAAGVDRLEGMHAPKKYTAGALEHIRDTYRAKLKELKR